MIFLMALSPFQLNFLSPNCTCPASSSACSTRIHFTVSSSQQTVQVDTGKKKRNPKPSFFDQIRDKWSAKSTTVREKLPWQEQEQKQLQSEPIEVEDEEDEEESEFCSNSSRNDLQSCITKSRVISAPWFHGSRPTETQFDVVTGNLENCENDETSIGFCRNPGVNVLSEANQESEVKIDETPVRFYEKSPNGGLGFKGTSFDGNSSRTAGSTSKSEKMRLPWERETRLGSVDGDRLSKRNTILVEKVIPEIELKRLRNVALRMVERIKVGCAGVTQELVDSIHEKWKEDEVVKLKFEGAPTLNMKRAHQVLESRTGGLVIWRSGSSIVLYRGMTYHLPCVQSYTKQNEDDLANSTSSTIIENDFNHRVGVMDSVGTTKSSITKSTRYSKDLSEKEIMDLSELDNLLDDLGPRFKDWSGPEPMPVDADLLSSVVPGYKRPFRLLPYGMRQRLIDKETTFYRQTARNMPPHFALGRNRELQGLARAMVKLWERSAIAKIAIKRGVQNTCNERMAEELKILTGGTLLSRNKDYILFYRGNDFLPPAVTKTLEEAQKLTALEEDEEEQARQKASALIHSKTKSVKVPMVAGTLAETMAATSRWGNQPTSGDIEKMRRDSALARHASLVRYLQKKLALAKGKMKKAEKALEKVQESLEPSELPTDLETISDEERFLFRKMGLSMKPYLLLGRRGMFDGTIENIHLHWKYRELVKLIVERKSHAQVKHIAISLEAESGGVLVSLDKTTKGHVIILYRGKNYHRPNEMRPKNLLTKRQALARSIELQRREALKHHVSDLTERMEKLKTELEYMMTVKEIDEETFYRKMDNASSSDDEMEEEEDEDPIETHDNGNEDDIV